MNRELEAIENVDAYVETIDENGNIEIKISESNYYMFQVFTIRAKRKKLIRLKYASTNIWEKTSQTVCYKNLIWMRNEIKEQITIVIMD